MTNKLNICSLLVGYITAEMKRRPPSIALASVMVNHRHA